jgi:hypothetical protein
MRTFAVIGLAALLAACNFRSENPGFAGVEREQASTPASATVEGDRATTEASFRNSDRQVTATPTTNTATTSSTFDAAPTVDQSTRAGSTSAERSECPCEEGTDCPCDDGATR